MAQTANVVDTNVLIIANGYGEYPANCIRACKGCLDETASGIIVIDDAGLIVREYRRNINPSGQPGPGDIFLIWLMQNMWDHERCEQVRITPIEDGSFAEFPTDPDLANFDRSDRKFVAVALTSANEPEIVNAADSDWEHAQPTLERNGVRLRFLCKW
jgi:hypothetical protein